MTEDSTKIRRIIIEMMRILTADRHFGVQTASHMIRILTGKTRLPIVLTICG